MPKQRSHQSRGPKKDPNKIVVSLSNAEKARLRRASNRQADIDAGMVTRSGAGFHGKTQEGRARNERRKSRQDLRSGKFE